MQLTELSLSISASYHLLYVQWWFIIHISVLNVYDNNMFGVLSSHQYIIKNSPLAQYIFICIPEPYNTKFGRMNAFAQNHDCWILGDLGRHDMRSPFCRHCFTKITAWMIIHVHNLIWNAINHPCINFYGRLINPCQRRRIDKWLHPTVSHGCNYLHVP